jgi:hypothetical protein
VSKPSVNQSEISEHCALPSRRLLVEEPLGDFCDEAVPARNAGCSFRMTRALDGQTTRKPRGNSLVQLPQRVNVSSMAGISIVATTTSSGSWQRSQISIV